ncbi:EIF2B4 [Bugula neritina]|uniref:EIF2B4 n=1 Tax=Bugula neritina TaxID=10212 RepID=A0A7J7IW60_BUGNE|nr:EIF2B4 [Bugula neritina]
MSQDSATPSSSSKKQDKKNRRAAKVQQKEASGESEQTNEAAVSTPPGASASSDVTSSSKLDKKARRAAKLKEKEQSQDSKESSAPSNKVETGDTKENQQPGPPPDGEKKKLSKAERRELQEAQRKAKLEKKLEATSQPSISSKDSIEKAVTNEITKKSTKTKSSKAHLSSKDNTVHLFSHLPSFKGSLPKTKSYIHPAISQIGLQYATGVVCGGNARAVALLCALKQVVQDYITPDQKELARDLHDQVKRYMEFLDLCRPILSAWTVSANISLHNSLLQWKDRPAGKWPLVSRL